MSYKPVNTYTGSAAADDAVVFLISGNGQDNDTYQLGSVEGVMDVYGSGDGTNFLTAPIALIDLGSTTPSVAVLETTANKHFGFRGRYKAVRVQQKGATAVVSAYLIATESA